MLDKQGYDEEMNRHNLAQEKLDRDKEKFFEEETSLHDKEQQIRREIDHATANMNANNKSLENLAEVKREYEVLIAGRREEPMLSDYYKHSDDMLYYQSIAAAVLGVGCGYGAALLL